MEISLDLVTEAARRRLAAVTPEVAGYIVLLAARSLEERLFEVSPTNLALSETGEVRTRPEGSMSEREVEAALRDLLASLLSLSPSPSPAVVAVAERAECLGLRALTAELTAALIPINHAAAQRALARLFRETRRARAVVDAPAPLAPPQEPTARASDAPRERGATLAGSEGAPRDGSGSAPEQELEIDVVIESMAPPPATAAVAPEREAPLEALSAPPAAPVAIAPPPSDELDEPDAPRSPLERRAGPVTVGGALVAAEAEAADADVRSDLEVLLARFLAPARSEAAMTLALRRLVGLEPRLEPAR